MEEIRDKKSKEISTNGGTSGQSGLELDEEVPCNIPFTTPDIEPLYTERAQPSPAVSGTITPMFEADSKRVRFIEPKVRVERFTFDVKLHICRYMKNSSRCIIPFPQSCNFEHTPNCVCVYNVYICVFTHST